MSEPRAEDKLSALNGMLVDTRARMVRGIDLGHRFLFRSRHGEDVLTAWPSDNLAEMFVEIEGPSGYVCYSVGLGALAESVLYTHRDSGGAHEAATEAPESPPLAGKPIEKGP